MGDKPLRSLWGDVGVGESLRQRYCIIDVPHPSQRLCCKKIEGSPVL